jgi:hypothetical protein
MINIDLQFDSSLVRVLMVKENSLAESFELFEWDLSLM